MPPNYVVVAPTLSIFSLNSQIWVNITFTKIPSEWQWFEGAESGEFSKLKNLCGIRPLKVLDQRISCCITNLLRFLTNANDLKALNLVGFQNWNLCTQHPSETVDQRISCCITNLLRFLQNANDLRALNLVGFQNWKGYVGYDLQKCSINECLV